MRYKATVAYDGLNYQGWQIQNHAPSIQEELQKVLSKINKKPSKVVGSGRTDSGVHALAQVFHFDSPYNLDPDTWVRALNRLLPRDIRIKKVEIVDEEFHARLHALSKTYIYYINCGEYDLFNRNYILQYNQSIDQELIDYYLKLMTGTHDFVAFNTTPIIKVKNQVRTIKSFEAIWEEDLLILTVTGNGFLKHMIRMIVGTMLACNEGKITMEAIETALEKGDKDSISYIAPGCGLYLKHVKY